MSLFNTVSIEPEEKSISGHVMPEEILNASSFKFFKKYLSNVRADHTYHFWTGGQWNMHDLLIYLLSITGKANLYVTTYAISEDSVRRLIYLKEQNLLGEIQCVFDFTAKEQKNSAYTLCKQHFNVTLTRMHAKVCIVQNEKWSMIVTGSANWTRNPKAERQLMCTSREVVDEDVKIITQLINGENPFKVR
jgi:hypothetical protein